MCVKLKAMTAEKCADASQPEFTIQTQERSVEIMYEKYDAAIQNGVEFMSCGRICGIGHTAQKFLRGLMKPSTGIDDQSVCTLDNDRFSPMTEEAELEGLAVLVNKNVNSSLIKMIKKSDVSEVFHGDISDIAPITSVVDEKISTGVRKIVASLKHNAFDHALISKTTPALIHTTCHSWQQQKHILPILITSRSFFFIVIDNVARVNTIQSGNTTDEITLEDVYRCVTCITGALSYKASELYAKLNRKGLNHKSSTRYFCPYPKIVVVGTYGSDEEHTKVQSTVENIKKWVSVNCSDTVQHNFEAKVVNAVDQSADDIQALITKFVIHDLKIPTPLSWELFRQMFSYVTKNVPFIQLEKAATIASLCDIATDEFPSVLNFYHEHGAFLYYPDVEYLRNIIIIDPKWLQEMLNKIFTPVYQSSLPMWKRLTTQGILVAPLCEELWHSEEVKNLPTGMVKLLEKYHLATPIDIDEEMCDYDGNKYFVPSILKSKESTQPVKTAVRLRTAPLHFIFPKTKHLPPGVFTNLIAALASKNTGSFDIDFKSEMCCNQITYWFRKGKQDKVILSATLTSITVVVERLKYCGDDYLERNFWSTCQEILSALTTQIKAVLEKSFKYFGFKLAFICTCRSSQGRLPHYVEISVDTQSTCNTVICEEFSEYTFSGDEQLWLKMAGVKHNEGRIFDSEISKLAELLKPVDQMRLTQALEVTLIDAGTSFPLIMSGWADATGGDARVHLVYHLNRLGLREAADGINKGGYKMIAGSELKQQRGKSSNT